MLHAFHIAPFSAAHLVHAAAVHPTLGTKDYTEKM